jgi:sphingomyelin phosphodiesterase
VSLLFHGAIRGSESERYRIFTGDVVEGAVWLVTGETFPKEVIQEMVLNLPDTEVTNDLEDAYTRMKGLGQTVGVL